MIDRDRMIKKFLELSAYDSESFHERKIADRLVGELKMLGLEVTEDDTGSKISDSKDSAGNLYAYLKGNLPGPGLLFAAHMDTVSPGIGKKPVIGSDGKVASNGNTVLGADDITGLVAILEMLSVIKEDNLDHPDIEVLFFAAEEPYCRGSSLFDYSKIKAKLAYVLDLDGPVGVVANRAPSIIRFFAEITGKSAHAGFEPEKGINAIVVAADAISRIKVGRIDDDTTANIGTISGGTGRNIVPGKVVLEGEVRSLNGEKAEEITSDIKKKFEEAALEAGAKFNFISETMIHAYSVSEDSPVIKRYGEAMQKLGYEAPKILSTFGGSDNNSLNLHGIEGIVVANAMNKVHTTEEYFCMDELVKSAQIILKLTTM